MTLEDEGLRLLRLLTANPDASFRDGQWDAIEHLVARRSRVLVVQRTGWGKSAVYFVATRLLRDQGSGPTVLISPLLALMRNQLTMAQRAGVRAVTINSGNREEWEAIEERISADEIDLLLISPERLNNARFRQDVLPDLVRRVGMLVVDEAHCISDWGHDFRPDYRRISRVIKLLPPRVPLLCTTATANDRVVADIREQLGDDLVVVRGTLDRESLALAVVDMPSAAWRMAFLAAVLPDLEGSGIVYSMTVRDADVVAEWLRTTGVDAAAYHGAVEPAERVELEQRLLDNDVKVLVATSALGMGFDKPDLGFVIHYQSPGSAIAYYQQVGRAGRALAHAPALLLRGAEDVDIQDYFIESAFPPRAQAEAVVALLAERAEPVSLSEIEAHVNVRHTRLQGMLKILEVDGAVASMGSRWERTLAPWAYDEDRVDRVTAERRAEQQAMLDYGATRECRMQFLRAQLDDHQPTPCGRCDNCRGQRWTAELDDGLVAAARSFARHRAIAVDPRKRWPVAVDEARGNIPVALQMEPGRALSLYNDAGWGALVRDGKHDGRFSDELVDAAVEVARGWRPDPAPEWITCVPSTDHDVVTDFAQRLARALRLPFHPVVTRVRPGPPQKEMENSAQQFRNAYGAFEVAQTLPGGPVLLVDDMADSRWTLTVVAAALLEAGSGPVHPLVLAVAVSS